MDSFHQPFMVPGTGHCFGGPGAWKIGQGSIVGGGTDGVNWADRSVTLNIVDRVENGSPPGMIIGTDDNSAERMHCMWPNSKTI